MSRWGAAALVACILVAAAYLPPRGAPPERPSWAAPARPPTSARIDARALADQWRAASLALRLAEARRHFEPEFARRRETDVRGAALLITGRAAPPELERGAREAIARVWDELDLGVSKVAVGVILDFGAEETGGRSAVPRENRWRSYLLPDSTDRAACIAWIPAERWPRVLEQLPPASRADHLADGLRSGLGPCAFYAAYGAPGGPVRRWLARRSYSLAQAPDWRPGRMNDSVGLAPFARDAATGQWSWDIIGGGGLPLSAIACLGGRSDRCADAVLAGAGHPGSDSIPRAVTISPWWWRADKLLLEDRFLADVARDVGRHRFLDFWGSSHGVEPSLAAALRVPVGEWTERWQRRFVPRLPLGPAVPPFAAVTGVLLAGLAVLSAALAASHREVRS